MSKSVILTITVYVVFAENHFVLYFATQVIVKNSLLINVFDRVSDCTMQYNVFNDLVLKQL